MLKKHVKRPIVFMVITLSILLMFGEGYATSPDITLVVNPKATEIHAGAEKIVITVDATGKNLTFTWKLSGPGKLEEEGAAAFYLPPEKIDQESASAVITVTVKEPSGQETVKSIAFTILPNLAPPATPSPVTPPSEKKKMSKGTITALSIGAVAALGGGIALAVGGGGDNDGSEPESPVRYNTDVGVTVGGYRWYLGPTAYNCESVCYGHGGYHEATRTYAGSDGSNANCNYVLNALGAPPDAELGDGVADDPDSSCGCYVHSTYAVGDPGPIFRRRGTRSTTVGCVSLTRHRVCACNE